MRQKVFRVMALLAALSLIVSPLSAFPVASAAGPAPSKVVEVSEVLTEGLPEGRTPPHLQELPTEILEFFGDGLSVEEFVARTGYVPNALSAMVSGLEAMMVIELQQAPLAKVYAENKSAGIVMKSSAMTDYIDTLEKTQSKVKASLSAAGVEVVSNYTTVFNGFLVSMPLSNLSQVKAMPEVKGVYRAPEHVPALTNSVELIGATDVWEDYGFDGEGIVIAVIDTGIDYTHGAFGGPGTPADYAANNPDIIEDGSFPTAKVVGGYDFAGTKYNAGCSAADTSAGVCSRTPVPDEDPLDENRHGTHVASISAGDATASIGKGVAPGAKLVALKIFGKAGSTNLTMNALDAATASFLATGYPQVINMSLGSSWGPHEMDDPSVKATEIAVAAGIVVVASAGNSSNSSYVTGSPGTATSAISVASSEDGYSLLDGFEVTAPASIAQVYPGSLSVNFNWNSAALPISGELVYPLPGSNPAQDQRTGCYPFNAENVALITGKIVLIDWTDPSCGGSVARAANVVNAGGIGVLMADDSDIFDLYIAGSAVVPALSIPKSVGNTLKTALAAGTVTMTFTNEYAGTVPYFETFSTDLISSFSSRGPRGYDSALKPEVTAPGGSIFAAAMGSGSGGTSLNGTSMAAPHVAGVAALMLQANPDWTPAFVKAALMNTATSMADGAPIPRSGAGRVDAYRAVDSSVLAIGDEGLTSLSFGVMVSNASSVTQTKQVTLHNTDTVAKRYDVAWNFQPGSPQAGITLAVSPEQIVVLPGAEAQVEVTLTVDLARIPVNISANPALLEEYFGFVTFTPDAIAPVVADFSASPLSGIAPLDVEFTGLASGEYSTCSWNFGDGGTSTSCNTSHTYAAAGVYSVSFTASGLGGTDVETKESLITVYAPALANFSASPLTGQPPLAVNFTDESTGAATSWSWDFGDGSTSTAQNPSHVYQNMGTYTVTLTAAGPGGTNTLVKPGYIHVTPHHIYLPSMHKSGVFGAKLTLAGKAPAGTAANDKLIVPFYLQPRPYTSLEITGDSIIQDAEVDSVLLDISHSGYITSSLWAYPALVYEDTPEEGTAGDIRMFGMEAFPIGSANYIGMAFNTWAPWHVPQPFFVEFDLYVDHNEDGVADFVFWNYNYGAVTGGTTDNQWVVLRTNLATGALSLGSTAYIYTDFNSGVMEWYVPAVNLGLTNTSANTTFDYQLFGYDKNGTEDETAPGSFDYMRLPFGWDYDLDPSPNSPSAQMEVWINSLVGYEYADPLGLMVIDYNGDIRGGGQAYFHPVVYPIETFTLLHTNDFHGRLQTDLSSDPSRGGSAYISQKVNDVRAEVGEEKVVLLDAGDIYFAAPAISQLTLGEASIDIYNMIGYNAAAYGNHEFDKGQEVLAARTEQSNFPWLGANLVLEGTDWDLPTWAEPYTLIEVGSGADTFTLGVIGVTTDETPTIVLAGTTDGIVFKDMTATIAHYYDEVMSQADALVVLAHSGNADKPPFKGLITVANELITLGKPVDLFIGGHAHQPTYTPVNVGGVSSIVSTNYYGRIMGRVNASINRETKKLTLVDYSYTTIGNNLPADPVVAARVQYWADLVAPIVNVPVGYTNINLVRTTNAESNIGNLITDSMRWKADELDDGEVNGSVQVAFTNPGGIRANLTIPAGATTPYTLTWGSTFEVLPFGNVLFMMDLKGYQIQALLDQSAKLSAGILQVSGLNHYWYNDTGTSSPTAYGAYGVMVDGEPLERDKTYRIVTNDFLSTGGDQWATFAQGTNRLNTGYDMHEAFYKYIQEVVGTIDTGDIGMGRVTRLDDVVTLLHTNDSHGYWAAATSGGRPAGMEYIAALIKAERTRNPEVIVLDAGDTFQGNSFAYFFKDRPDNPIAGGLNLMGYDAFTIGNHEFNFGPETFATMLGQLEMPVLGSVNLEDDGSYGFINDNVDDYFVTTASGLKVAVFGLTNPRVYRYELPTNIPGLTFHPVLTLTQEIVDEIVAVEAPDVLVGLTHIGFAPYADEIDSDKLIAENISGIDVLIGAHSHTRLNPSVVVSSPANPDGTLIGQAERYALNLGKINLGFIGGNMVLREGYLIPAGELPRDPAMIAYLAPFLTEINEYNSTVVGQTTVPVDALQAYTQETNGANMQADAAVYVLETNGIDVDVHLSGAMANRAIAPLATPANPVNITKGDLFNLMPYENSLVVLSMNGPQLKTVLERAYRNYYYYKYVPGYGGYSYYTTCMLATDFGNQITYSDRYPQLPDGNNVVSLNIAGALVDFDDADTYYNVSTVNYLAAGSCNFNNSGETIWPLAQIIHDTQYYVRDTVIDYVMSKTEPIAPAIEGRLVFQTTP